MSMMLPGNGTGNFNREPLIFDTAHRPICTIEPQAATTKQHKQPEHIAGCFRGELFRCCTCYDVGFQICVDALMQEPAWRMMSDEFFKSVAVEKVIS